MRQRGELVVDALLLLFVGSLITRADVAGARYLATLSVHRVEVDLIIHHLHGVVYECIVERGHVARALVAGPEGRCRLAHPVRLNLLASVLSVDVHHFFVTALADALPVFDHERYLIAALFSFLIDSLGVFVVADAERLAEARLNVFDGALEGLTLLLVDHNVDGVDSVS